MITYRDAARDDARELADFSRDTFVATFGHNYPPEDLRDYIAAKYGEPIQRREIENPVIHYRLAFAGGAIAGYCKTGPYDLPHQLAASERALELHRLYVSEATKGAGAAQALMDDALAWARGQGANTMYLSVWETNFRAQAFYRRYGFEHVTEHGFMVGSVRDRDFIWRRAL